MICLLFDSANDAKTEATTVNKNRNYCCLKLNDEIDIASLYPSESIIPSPQYFAQLDLSFCLYADQSTKIATEYLLLS